MGTSDEERELTRLLSDDPGSERLMELAMAVAQQDLAAGHDALRRVGDAVATHPGRRAMYLLVRYNQGALERDAGYPDAAIATWSEALEHALDLSDETERFARAVIEFNAAELLRQQASTYQAPELLARALTLYDELIERERAATLPGTRDRVARAAVNRVIAAAESDSYERTDAALAGLAALADQWDSADLRQTAADMAADLGRAEEIVAPWTSRLGGEDAPEAAWKDRLHVEALQRLERYGRFGEPFVLLLRSFGRISVEAGSIGGVPTLTATMPGISIGHPLEAEFVRWLEQRALVVSVAQPDATLIDERDSFPRLALGDDWYPFVQQLMLSAEALVVMATDVSAGLLAETRAIEWLARADDTVVITAPGVDPTALGSFPHRLTWGGGADALERDEHLRALLARLDGVGSAPLAQRVAAAEVARRTRAAAAAAHQTQAGATRSPWP